jgi:hypothetical protein
VGGVDVVVVVGLVVVVVGLVVTVGKVVLVVAPAPFVAVTLPRGGLVEIGVITGSVVVVVVAVMTSGFEDRYKTVKTAPKMISNVAAQIVVHIDFELRRLRCLGGLKPK